MTQIQEIDGLIARLKTLKSSIKKKDRLSERAMNADSRSRGYQKLSTDLNWQCMNIEKETTDFARAFEASSLNVDTDEKTYRPSGFHEYKH